MSDSWILYVGVAGSGSAVLGFLFAVGKKGYQAIRAIDLLVHQELRPNGGGSTKDLARSASNAAQSACVSAEFANRRTEEQERKLDALIDLVTTVAAHTGRTSEQLGDHVRRSRVVETAWLEWARGESGPPSSNL